MTSYIFKHDIQYYRIIFRCIIPKNLVGKGVVSRMLKKGIVSRAGGGTDLPEIFNETLDRLAVITFVLVLFEHTSYIPENIMFLDAFFFVVVGSAVPDIVGQ